jgi:hypothetical protein
MIGELKDFDPENEQKLIEYSCEKVLAEFYNTNQYYYFNTEAKDELKNIYSILLYHLKAGSETTENISAQHYQRLKSWLLSTNPFAEKMYDVSEVEIEKVPCFEYTPDLQIEILHINLSSLLQPVLDIGCGQNGNMVNFLRKNDIEAFGIDVCNFNQPDLSNSNWLEFDYGVEKWGTIISNLGFSNHFNHHHLREDGNFEEYAVKYMEILKSLKPKGSFHYAPDLDFIEKYLDKHNYDIKQYSFGRYSFNCSIVTKKR